MKKFLLILCVFIFASLVNADEKKGFLTSKYCAEHGVFADCRLESFVCASEDCFKEWGFDDEVKEELVLFVHSEGKYYNVKLDGIKRYKLDDALNRNDVSLIGKVEGDMIVATSFKAPPPPTKSFFKGCL